MAKTVNQPSWAPTNKLTGALVAAALFEVFKPHIITLGATWLGLSLGGPATMILLQMIVAGGVGYFIKDKPNV